MAPSVSSETQLTRVERTWRFSCYARDRVIGPFIVCIEVMSSSKPLVIFPHMAAMFSNRMTQTGGTGSLAMEPGDDHDPESSKRKEGNRSYN
jgi:hypothetical protein